MAAAREAGDRAGVPFVINARTDVFLAKVGAPEERLAATVERGRAYRDAGADCIFVPGLADAATIERLIAELGAPVSLLAGPACPPLRELERLGVARVSLGPGSLGIAMAALNRAAAALLDHGELPAELGFRTA